MLKKFVPLASALAFLLLGCKSSYDVVYQNQGSKVKARGVSKPVYDKATDTYTFTDAQGQRVTKDASLIREIVPHQNTPEVSGSSFKSR